jgi:hypothetical protein
MTTKTVEEQLKALIPSSIDDVIRAHKDQGSLRFSTNEDLRVLAATIPAGTDSKQYGLFKGSISRWNLLTLDVHSEVQQDKFVVLFGWNDSQGQTWNTSQIVRLDRGTGLLFTHSGSLYKLRGPQGTPDDLDLLHLCIYLHQTGAGRYFGVPHFFY